MHNSEYTRSSIVEADTETLEPGPAELLVEGGHLAVEGAELAAHLRLDRLGGRRAWSGGGGGGRARPGLSPGKIIQQGRVGSFCVGEQRVRGRHG